MGNQKYGTISNSYGPSSVKYMELLLELWITVIFNYNTDSNNQIVNFYPKCLALNFFSIWIFHLEPCKIYVMATRFCPLFIPYLVEPNNTFQSFKTMCIDVCNSPRLQISSYKDSYFEIRRWFYFHCKDFSSYQRNYYNHFSQHIGSFILNGNSRVALKSEYSSKSSIRNLDRYENSS